MCVSRGDARQKRKRMRRKAYGVFPVGFEPEKKPPPPPPHWYPKEAALFRILGILRLSHHPLLYPGLAGPTNSRPISVKRPPRRLSRQSVITTAAFRRQTRPAESFDVVNRGVGDVLRDIIKKFPV